MPLMPFTERDHIPLIQDGKKPQTTRLPRKNTLKVGDILYCYYKPRQAKSCRNCIVWEGCKREWCCGKTVGTFEEELQWRSLIKESGSQPCKLWNNYFGEAIVTQIWHYWDTSLWKEAGEFEHYDVLFKDMLVDEAGKKRLESWAEYDGFKNFEQADQWFIAHHGTEWTSKNLDVILFEGKWLARKVASASTGNQHIQRTLDVK